MDSGFYSDPAVEGERTDGQRVEGMDYTGEAFDVFVDGKPYRINLGGACAPGGEGTDA